MVDDTSTDRTVALAQSFGDRRIRLFRNDRNLGLEANWQRAMSYASGKYVKVLCQDDLLEPECLSRQLNVLEDRSNAGVVLALCNRTVIDAQERVILRRKPHFDPGINCGKKLIQTSIRQGTNLLGEPVVGLFRRNVLAKTSMCNPSNPYMADLSLWAELLKHGDAYIDAATLARFRISAEALTATTGPRQAASFREFIRSMRSDPFYHPSLFDAVCGTVHSFQKCVLRNAFLTFHLWRVRRRELQARHINGSLSAAAPFLPHEQDRSHD